MDTSEPQQESPIPSRRWSLRSVLLVSLLGLVLGLPFVARPRLDMNDFYPYGDSCQNNLKILCLTFQWYAADLGGVFPELSPKPGVLAVREDEDYPGIYPKYLTDVYFLTCPSSRILRPRPRWFREEPPPPPGLDTVSNDRCYLYLAYIIPDQATLERFAVAYRARIVKGKPFDEDLSAVSNDGVPLQIPRLRNGITGITDTEEAQSTIPVFVERYPNGHVGEIGHVVYLDGHAEWIKWGAKWPMTPEAMGVLLALDGLGNAAPNAK